MSQLLLEYVLDTTQDLEKRQWVYELWHMSHDESCHDMSHVQMPAAFCDILWLQFHLKFDSELILS